MRPTLSTMTDAELRIVKPIALDLCCGMGGWAEGLIAAGWDVVGVDVEEDFSGKYPGRFFCGDVRLMQWPDCPTCQGTGNFYRNDQDGDFLDCDDCDGQGKLEGWPSLVVASPPCQEFSRHAMPWTRKRNPPPPDMSLVEACRLIGKLSGAPFILENVREAQRWLGKADWHFGPFYLWGDVPALMPRFNASVFRKKESYGSKAKAERAKVPFELAAHVGRVFVCDHCRFCGCSSMSAETGKYGCPNCFGEGLNA